MNRLVLVVVVVVILGLGSLVYVSRPGLPPSFPNHRSSTTSIATPPPNQSTTLGSSNKNNSFYMAMNVVPTNRLIPLGGNANFTVVLYSGGDINGTYSLSAAVPSDLQFQFGSTPVSISGAGPHFGNVTVTSTNKVNEGSYNVTIFAKGPNGVANQTFSFTVQRNLILLYASAREITPAFARITLKAGDSLTWMSMDPPMSDEAPSAYHIVWLLSAPLNINTTSNYILNQFDVWNYAFTQPGTYQWYDGLDPTVKGEVVVTA